MNELISTINNNLSMRDVFINSISILVGFYIVYLYFFITHRMILMNFIDVFWLGSLLSITTIIIATILNAIIGG